MLVWVGIAILVGLDEEAIKMVRVGTNLYKVSPKWYASSSLSVDPINMESLL